VIDAINSIPRGTIALEADEGWSKLEEFARRWADTFAKLRE
jgi:hypothetical protein